jgi:hypothetical protein
MWTTALPITVVVIGEVDVVGAVEADAGFGAGEGPPGQEWGPRPKGM